MGAEQSAPAAALLSRCHQAARAEIRRRRSRTRSAATAGRRSGATASTAFITIIRPRTKSWALSTGTARLLLGGPNGLEITVKPGDCALLPAGTGHCRLDGSADFLVVGGYPPNQPWDLRREAISEAAKREMAKVPFPEFATRCWVRRGRCSSSGRALLDARAQFPSDVMPCGGVIFSPAEPSPELNR